MGLPRLLLTAALGLADGHAVAAPATRVRPSTSFDSEFDCERRLRPVLTTVAGALERRDARWGSAYVGLFDEHETQMVRAGVRRGTAREMLTALDRVLAAPSPHAGFRLLGQALRGWRRRQRLFVCVLSADCSLSTRADEVLVYLPRRPERILVQPFPTLDAHAFTLGVLTPISGFVARWLHGEWLNALEPGREVGASDRFVRQRDFGELFTTLFEISYAVELERVLRPRHPAGHLAGVARLMYHDLVGQSAAMTALARDLGLTEATFLHTTECLVREALVATAHSPSRRRF